MNKKEHNWIWINQGTKYIKNNPYPVDYWYCVICKKETTTKGSKNPPKYGCKK